MPNNTELAFESKKEIALTIGSLESFENAKILTLEDKELALVFGAPEVINRPEPT